MSRTTSTAALFLLCALVLGGCGDDDAPLGDAGAGALDAGRDATLAPLDSAVAADAPATDGASGDACVSTAETCNGTDDDCNGTVDDGASLCTAGLTCLGGRCRAGGVVSWARVFGDAEVGGVAVDPMGRLTVVGCFTGSLSFGGPTRIANGERDGYALGLDATGAYRWDQTFGGPAPDSGECAHDVAMYPADSRVVVVGDFVGTAYFGTTPRTSAGGLDSYVVTLAHDGSVVWDAEIRSAADVQKATSVGISADGVFVGGVTRDATTFGAGSPIVRADVMGDGFVVRLGLDDGAYGWSKLMSSASPDRVESVLVSGGWVLAGGSVGAAIDFGGGVRAVAGSGDAFVVNLRAGDGGLIRDRVIGGPGFESARALGEAGGSLVVGGSFTQMLDLGGGVRAGHGVSADAFVTTLDRDWGWMWDDAWGDATNPEVVTAVAGDASGLVVAGAALGLPFVRRYAFDGRMLWERTFGVVSTATVVISALALAPDGSILVVGTVDGDIPTTAGTVSGRGGFVASLVD